jgi:iron complex outermembrane receptor protein
MNSPNPFRSALRLSLPGWLGLLLNFALILTCAQSGVRAQGVTGAVAGRVFNATGGVALRNAIVTVEPTGQQAVTDDDGVFRLANLPAGSTRLRVSYLGFTPQTVTLMVPAGSTVTRDLELSLRAENEPVKLSDFTVVADREMSAQAIALNERRLAPNIKNVVAYDEFGDRSAENIGDFLRFLPGVGIDEPAQIAQGVTLRGLPANTTGIQIDGAEVASARGNSREQSLLDIPVGNVSRVEVTKVPTPDQPANSLGGSLNIIRKSGFESKRRILNFQSYFILDERQLSLSGGPRGPTGDLSPRYQEPSIEISALLPLTPRVAVTASASRTWRLKPMERADYLDTQGDWHFVNGYQRLSTWQSLANILRTWSVQLGTDIKLTERDSLGVNVQYRNISNNIMRLDFIANYGAGATGDRTFTQGSAAANGSVTQMAGSNQETGADTVHTTIKYLHRGQDWRIDAFGSHSNSQSFLDDLDNGHFNNVSTALTGIILRGEGIGETNDPIPVRYSATRAGAPVDVYRGANFVLGNPTSNQNAARTDKYTVRLDLTREFGGTVPVTLKTGVFADRMQRDRRGFNRTWTFTPNGSTSTAARSAGNFDVFDTAFNAEAPKIFDRAMEWVSVAKVYELYRQRPEWFVRNLANEHQSRVTSSSRLIETVSAGYVRGDVRLLERRLWLTGGVRFERTEDDGAGALNDPSRQYVRDARNNLVLGANGQPVLITTDALERAQLRYVERGAQAVRSYGDWFPSFNASYHFTENLVLRAAYARTLGRPNYNFIVPGTTFSEPTAAQPTITVNNTGLKPWMSDNFDLSLETYQIKGGSGSIGAFRKKIKDFFGGSVTDATPELLARYGLPDDPLYLNYDISTQMNVGDATITGYEFAYSQSLFFLPSWARGLQVFGSATRLELSGTTLADFTGYSPRNYAGGINLVRPRFYVKFTVTHQGVTRGPFITPNVNNGIPADTYTYQGQRLRYGINAEYSFSKAFSLYGSIANLGGFIGGNLRYSPTTPDFMKERRRQEFPSTVQVGIKGRY